jgi:hypothetical protein
MGVQVTRSLIPASVFRFGNNLNQAVESMTLMVR